LTAEAATKLTAPGTATLNCDPCKSAASGFQAPAFGGAPACDATTSFDSPRSGKSTTFSHFTHIVFSQHIPSLFQYSQTIPELIKHLNSTVTMAFELSSLPSINSMISFAGRLFSQVPMNENVSTRTYIPYGDAPSCPGDSPLSCHNSTTAPDSCCFIYPGGQLLSTQFWDASPAIGPADRWTLHGLWLVPHLSCKTLLTCKIQGPTSAMAHTLHIAHKLLNTTT
jgi:ribonuclease T2